MKILFSLVLLALISCGGKGGGGSGVTPGATTVPYPYTAGSGFETFDKFKSAVANNQWAQNPDLARINYYKFNYLNPPDPTSTVGCDTLGSGIFSLKFCKTSGYPTPAHVTEEIKGVITNPLKPLTTIKEVVSNSVFYTDSRCNVIKPAVPTVPCAYRDGIYWIVVRGTEIYVFNLAFPLGGNPIYYKNTSTGEAYNLGYYFYNIVP